jgi:hypothetical protein
MLAARHRQNVTASTLLDRTAQAVVGAMDAVAGDPSSARRRMRSLHKERRPGGRRGHRARPPRTPTPASPARAWAWSRTSSQPARPLPPAAPRCLPSSPAGTGPGRSAPACRLA